MGRWTCSLFLGLQTRLVWDVAHVYSQRPSLRELSYLYANVVGTAFVAGEIEDADLSEQIQPVLSSVLGSTVSALPGLQTASTIFVNSVISGTANAFLTLRVGLNRRRVLSCARATGAQDASAESGDASGWDARLDRRRRCLESRHGGGQRIGAHGVRSGHRRWVASSKETGEAIAERLQFRRRDQDP